MNRPLHWISLTCAVAAFCMNAAGASAHGLIIACATATLLLSAMEILVAPRRALPLLVFLLSLPVLLSILSLYGKAVAEAAFVSVALALQARLLFLRAGNANHEKNRAQAEWLRGKIPERSLVFVDMDIEGECPVSDIEPGHLIRIRPGDSLPADGQVTFGSSFVEETALTGDRESQTKSMGSYVLAGTKNRNGSFLYRANMAARNSFVTSMASSLERGFPFESLLGIGEKIKPAILGRPFLLLEGMLILGALVVYAVTGPSLTPLLNVFLVSSGTLFAASVWALDSRFLRHCSQKGFYWKSKASVLEVALTGTLVSGAHGALTEGRLRLSAMRCMNDLSEDGALRLAGPLARKLESAVAFAVLQELQSRNIRLEMMEAYLELPGGASGIILGEDLRWIDLESARLEALPIAPLGSFFAEHQASGEEIFLLLRNEQIAAAFAFSDRTLPTAGQGIQLLKREEVPFLLVSRESELPTRKIREELAITHYSPDTGEEEAIRLLERLEKDGLHPLWLATTGWKVEGGLIPSSLAFSLGESAKGLSARGDIYSIAQMICLAKSYSARSASLFLAAAISQALLLAACPFLDPRWATLLSLTPTIFLLGGSENSN